MIKLTPKSSLRNAALLLVLVLGVTAHGHAQGGCTTGGTGCGTAVAPEIDPSLATGAVALLGGIALIVRGRRRQ